MTPLSSHLAVSVSVTEPIQYRTYLIMNLYDFERIYLSLNLLYRIPNLSDSWPIFFWSFGCQTCWILNLSDSESINSEPIGFQTYRIPKLSDSEPVKYKLRYNNEPLRYRNYEIPGSVSHPLHPFPLSLSQRATPITSPLPLQWLPIPPLACPVAKLVANWSAPFPSPPPSLPP